VLGPLIVWTVWRLLSESRYGISEDADDERGNRSDEASPDLPARWIWLSGDFMTPKELPSSGTDQLSSAPRLSLTFLFALSEITGKAASNVDRAVDLAS
jgi:hypothetical protein